NLPPRRYGRAHGASCAVGVSFEGEVNVRTAASRRIPFAIAWGALGVVAWATFTILASGGSAHAEEEPDRPLDGLTSLVGSPVGAGAGLAADVPTETVSPAVETGAPAVTQPGAGVGDAGA